MTDVGQDQRGVASGMLSLSRNLRLITSASVMGAVLVVASGAIDMAAVHPDDVAAGMRVTFAAAAVLIIVALALPVGSRASATRPSL
jgi:hypothetical protein